MTGAGNHTFLIVSDGSAALVDAGVGKEQHLAAVADALANAHGRLERVLVTHAHPDHASGAPALARRFASPEFRKHSWPAEDAKYDVPWRPLADNETVSIGRERVVALHTPGHSPDHVVFWHEEGGAVFTGDLVIPGSSVMIDWTRGGSLAAYLASLERVLALRPRVLFPAHGPRVDEPDAVLNAHLAHRRRREREVIEALQHGRRTVQAIAEFIYHGLDPALMPAAQQNVRAHLEKLKAEGRAAEEEPDTWNHRE